MGMAYLVRPNDVISGQPLISKPLLHLTFAGLHAWHTDRASRSQAPFLFRHTILAYIAPLLDDMRSVEEYVAKEASEIDYTFVLPPGLNNKPVTGEKGQDKITLVIQ